MSAKVVDVIQKMIQNPKEIQDLAPSGNEYYFRFKGHTMSLFMRDNHAHDLGGYSLYIYLDTKLSTSELAARLESGSPEEFGIKVASFHSAQYDEAAFRGLFDVLVNKWLPVDEIFDDILSTD